MPVPSPGRGPGSVSGGATGAGTGGGKVEETNSTDHDTDSGATRGAAMTGADEPAMGTGSEPIAGTTWPRASRTTARMTPKSSSREKSATLRPGKAGWATVLTVPLDASVAGGRTG